MPCSILRPDPEIYSRQMYFRSLAASYHVNRRHIQISFLQIFSFFPLDRKLQVFAGFLKCAAFLCASVASLSKGGKVDNLHLWLLLGNVHLLAVDSPQTLALSVKTLAFVSSPWQPSMKVCSSKAFIAQPDVFLGFG